MLVNGRSGFMRRALLPIAKKGTGIRNTIPSASAISGFLLNSFTRQSANSAKQSFFFSRTLVLNYEAPRFDRSFILCDGCV